MASVVKKVFRKPSITNIVKEQCNSEDIRQVADNFIQIAKNIQEPRTRPVAYPLFEILFIAIVAVVCGAQSYQEMAMFGETQFQWLKKFLKLEFGIPSHDTFLRIFHLLPPQETLKLYQEIINGLSFGSKGKQIAIDGKTSRGCYNKKGESLLHIVSAYDTDHGISLAQHATKNEEGKTVGEFSTIPKVLEMLDIKDALITIDAGGCYAEITDKIKEGGGDYAITLKENQPKLYAVAKTAFEEQEQTNFTDVSSYTEENRGHGREEKRTYYAIPLPQVEGLAKWQGMQSLVMGKFLCIKNGEESVSIRYYISSLSSDFVERLGQSLRSHWGIENHLHCVLDVCFGEDANRTRRGHGAENLSLLRRLALAMLNQVKGKKTFPTLMYQAALDQNFRTKILKKFLMR